MEPNKKDMIRLEREAVIKTTKSEIIAKLARLIELESDKAEFLKMCKRLDYIFRSWYSTQFEDLMQLYSVFDPSHGAEKLQQQSLTPDNVDNIEQNFLKNLFKVMEKSHFKLYNDKDEDASDSKDDLLTLPISMDKSQYVIFHRGIGKDRTSGYFIMDKVDMLISRTRDWLVQLTGPGHFLMRNTNATSSGEATQMNGRIENPSDEDLCTERFRMEKMDCSLRNLFGKNTIQEPTFEQMIIVYRLATPHSDNMQSDDRSIHIKRFKDIPMADIEMIRPAKKNPGLTPMDWVQFLASAIVGLVALIGSLETPQSIWVAFAISSALVGYCTNIYFTFQQNKEIYQKPMTNSMYEKQLDSGNGTLLYLCHDIIDQEVKAGIISLFILLKQGKTSIEDLDFRCEELLETEFGEKSDFYVADTIKKLERMGIVCLEEMLGKVCVPSMRHVNEIIGLTTEEIVAKVREGLT